MKRITQEITNPDIVWVAHVSPLAIKETLANLIDEEVYGFHVSDDRGGSGGWKIRFDREHDEEQVRKLLKRMITMGRINYIDWILVEVDSQIMI
jgi:hypothetical protein